MSDRPSFSKNKVSNYSTGFTGITGTSESSIKPISELTTNLEGKFNSSELLYNNIDKLTCLLNRDIDQENGLVQDNQKFHIIDDDDEFTNLTEEEVIKNLDHHLNSNPQIKQEYTNQSLQANINIDIFCINCGQKYNQLGNFCGNCGNKRQKANVI